MRALFHTGFSCFNTVEKRCDYGKVTPQTDAKNIMANRVSTRRAMFLADAVISGATPGGALKGCKKKFEDMPPPAKASKPATTKVKNQDKDCPIAEAQGPWPMTPDPDSSKGGKWDPAPSRRVELRLIVPDSLKGKAKKPADQCKGSVSANLMATSRFAAVTTTTTTIATAATNTRLRSGRWARTSGGGGGDENNNNAEGGHISSSRAPSEYDVSESGDEVAMEDGADMANALRPSYERQFARDGLDASFLEAGEEV